ncbi:uncharacterized protein [Aegilops tauschii subsp. strangulata]|uniref:uncharacterized protein n=1 Tax=Aegilops tauschii subsp. strangulata TaxID=200361 RepID=UPI003CC88989
MASRKLRHYFQAHEIIVITRFPLQCILRNLDATGRIVEWALELSSFALKFESTSTIQSRALAEFIAEWTPMQDEEIQESALPGKESTKEWIMYFDGAFSLQGRKATNNTTEYEGLLAGLRIAVELGIKKLILCGDSQLVVKQVNKDYQSPLMEAYMEEVRKLEEHFDGLQIEHVPRAENSTADHLSKCAAQKLPVESGTFVLHLNEPSVPPSVQANKRRKLNTGKYFPEELPEATGKNVVGNNDTTVSE